MKYYEWCNLQGKNRWYHDNGSARVILDLDYNWADIFNVVTANADLYFAAWEIPCDIDFFTAQFFAMVPTAWFKYKTVFEMFSGTLDGTAINPDVFEAGFTRTTNSSRVEDNTYTDNDVVTSNANGTSTQDAHSDVVDTKQRSLSYNQGVQGLTNINNNNIGNLGNKYASGIGDNILTSETDYGLQNVHATTADNSTRNRQNSEDKSDTFTETIHETRINYYDNLAFLRERLDRLKNLVPFHSYFESLFYLVQSLKGDW